MSTASITTRVERHHIIRQRTFAVSGRDITLDVIASVLALLRGERATGRVTINVSQGSPSVIQFEESSNIA